MTTAVNRHLRTYACIFSITFSAYHYLYAAEATPISAEDISGLEILIPDTLDDASTDRFADVDDFWDDFTFKISQQTYAQLYAHTVRAQVGDAWAKPLTTENNRLNVLVKYQHAFAQSWLIQGSAQAKIYWPGDYESGNKDQSIHLEYRWGDTEYRVNEFFVQKSVADHSFKLGRQTVVWGEALGNSVLDVINTNDFRDLSVIEIEDARLNQWMLVWDYYRHNSRLSSFINFYPEFNPPARQGSPLSIASTSTLTGAGRTGALVEVGSQLKWSFELSDVAIMAAYLYENVQRLEFKDSPPFTPTYKTNDYWLFGASMNRAFGKWLIKWDLAFSHGLLADTVISSPSATLPSSHKKNQLGTSLGFEYPPSNDQSLSVSVSAGLFLDKHGGLNDGELPITDDIFGTWLVRYSHRFLNEELILSSTMNGDLNGERLLASASLSYVFNDHWSAMGQIISTWATKTSRFYFLDRDIRLGMTITYSF